MARTLFARAVVVGGALLRAPHCALALALVGGWVGGLVGGCNPSGKPPPTTKPVFPTGLAVSPDGTRLVVVSSNFDLAFDNGAVVVANLTVARAALGDPDTVVTNAYVAGAAVFLPSLGDRPVFDPSGAHLFVTTRGQNLLHEIEVDGAGVLSCGEASLCSQGDFALQLGANDPYDVVLFDGPFGEGGVRGLITHLSSNQAEIFTLDPAVTGPTRLRVESNVVFFGEGVTGVRSAVLRPAGANNDAEIFVTLQRQIDNLLSGTSLAVFTVPGVNRGDDVEFAAVDLTGLTGSLTARGIAVVPDRTDGRPTGSVAVVVVLRSPDALARFAWDDDVRAFSLTHVGETCEGPTNVVAVAGADPDGDVLAGGGPAEANAALGGVDRVLVTCQAGEVVQAIDPLTLQVQDSLRFYGRNPYAIAVDPLNGEAFVTFFLDDSVGVLDLAGADGSPRLSALGRIGTPLPPPQDGRE